MRGLRTLVTVLLVAAIGIAQFLPMLGTQTVHAADQLPGTVADMVVKYEANIKALDQSWTTTYEYYKANIEGKTPTSFPEINGSGTKPVDVFNEMYRGIYVDVSQVNEDWQNHTLITFLDKNLFATGVSNSVVDSQLKDEQKYILKNELPFIAYIYYGFKILQAMDADAATRKSIVDSLGGEAIYQQKFKDLDVGNKMHLVKPKDLASRLPTGGYSAESGTIYPSLDGGGGFYPDYVSIVNLILAQGPVTDDASREAFKTAILSAASAIDGSTSGVAENPTDVCAGASALQPSTWFPVAFCTITVAIRDLGGYMMVSAGSLLAKTAGIPGGAEIRADKDLFSFVQGTALDGRVEDKLQDNNLGAISRAAYARVLNIVNGVVLLLLIGIALANILQIQISVYSFKKMLPGLIIGLILANSSYFIVRAGLEISGYVADGLITKQDIADTGHGAGDFIKTFEDFGFVNKDPSLSFKNADGSTNLQLVFQQFILDIFLWIAAILVLILAFLFAIRSLIFFLLVPLSPVAFIGLYFPPLGFAWKRWSAMMISWIFMPVVAFFWLWLGFIWFNSVSGKAGSLGAFLGYVFGISMIYLAMKTPFTLAGEAKQYVEKWNATGQGLAKRYTPYGAGLRGYNQVKNNMAERDKMLNSGVAIQNKWARKLGGDRLNKALIKGDLKTEKLKAEQSAVADKLKSDALQELSKNKLEGFLKGLQNSNIKHVRKLGEVLDKHTKGIGTVMDKLVAGGWIGPTNFAQRDAYIRDNAALSNLAKNKANLSLTDSYYNDAMGVMRAQREFEAEADQKSAEKTQGDAKMKAAHRNLTSSIVSSDDLIEELKGVDPTMDKDMDAGKLMSYKNDALRHTRPDLARKLAAYQSNKNVFKSSNKHISSAQKTDAAENAKKQVAEVAFGTAEVGDAGKFLFTLNAKEVKGKYDGLSGTDVPDFSSRFGGLSTKIGVANSEEKVPQAEEAAREMLKAVNAMPATTAAEVAIQEAYVEALEEYITAPKHDTKEIKDAATDFQRTKLYKDLQERVTTPVKNFNVR